MPPGATQPGQMQPGAFPGGNGQPGFNNGGQSPFGSGVAADSPEFVIQQFLEKLKGEELTDVAAMFSRKATGLAKAIREGKASAGKISELKSGVDQAKALPTMTLQAKHVVILEHGDGGNQNGYSSAPQSTTQGRRGQQGNRAKPTLRVQFTVIQEEGQMVIQDIKINNTSASIRQREGRTR